MQRAFHASLPIGVFRPKRGTQDKNAVLAGGRSRTATAEKPAARPQPASAPLFFVVGLLPTNDASIFDLYLYGSDNGSLSQGRTRSLNGHGQLFCADPRLVQVRAGPPRAVATRLSGSQRRSAEWGYQRAVAVPPASEALHEIPLQERAFADHASDTGRSAASRSAERRPGPSRCKAWQIRPMLALKSLGRYLSAPGDLIRTVVQQRPAFRAADLRDHIVAVTVTAELRWPGGQRPGVGGLRCPRS